MRTKRNKCIRTNSKKSRSDDHSSCHIDMLRQVRIVLRDCMQPRVILKRIDVPPKNKNRATIFDVSDQCSSQDEDGFEGFAPKDNTNINQNSGNLEPDVDKVKSTGKVQNLMAKLASNPLFQSKYREWEARTAMTPSAGAYHLLLDENDEEEVFDDAKTLVEDDEDDLNSARTVKTNDPEFYSHIECDETDAGSRVAIKTAEDNMDELSYEYSDADDHSDMNVAQVLQVNPENSEDDDVIIDQDFYGTEYEIDFEDER